MPNENVKQSKGTPLWRLSKKFQYAADRIIPDSLVFCLINSYIPRIRTRTYFNKN